MLIKCETLDGTPVWINSENIETVRPSDDNTLLTYSSGGFETLNVDAEVLAGWLRDGQPAI